MGKGIRNRKNRKEALAIKSSGDSRPIKSIARALRRNRNYHASN